MSTLTSSRATDGPFDDLRFVFAQTGTRLLSAAQEHAAAQQIWRARRRVRLLLLWSASERFGGLPPEPGDAKRELPTPLRSRLLADEERARRLVGEPGPEPKARFRSAIASELDRIDDGRQTLFRHNLRLVAWIAKGFLGKGLDLVDLFQEGAMALLWSIDRFDPGRGTRLSTFASYAVRLGMVRALSDKGRMIRIPNYRLKEVIETSTARTWLANRLGREPSSEEISRETGFGRESVSEILAAIRPLASLDAPIPGSERLVGDAVEDESSPSPFQRLASLESVRLAGRALSRLPPRERRTVTLRYGLGGHEEHTYEDIGRALGLSRERTRQLEHAAREKLRTWLKAG